MNRKIRFCWNGDRTHVRRISSSLLYGASIQKESENTIDYALCARVLESYEIAAPARRLWQVVLPYLMMCEKGHLFRFACVYATDIAHRNPCAMRWASTEANTRQSRRKNAQWKIGYCVVMMTASHIWLYEIMWSDLFWFHWRRKTSDDDNISTTSLIIVTWFWVATNDGGGGHISTTRVHLNGVDEWHGMK